MQVILTLRHGLRHILPLSVDKTTDSNIFHFSGNPSSVKGHVRVVDIGLWCRCGDYLHNYFQVFRVQYAISTSGTQFIFTSSAVRGSVGLMSWAFTFFLMGFTLPTGSQMALSWAAAIMPPNTKFPSRLLTFWAFNAAATIVWGVLCTVFAIFFLLASLYEIQYSPVASGESSALLIFTNSPKYAFWLAVSCISIGCLHIVGLNLVLICCNSWESLRGMYLLN